MNEIRLWGAAAAAIFTTLAAGCQNETPGPTAPEAPAPRPSGMTPSEGAPPVAGTAQAPATPAALAAEMPATYGLFAQMPAASATMWSSYKSPMATVNGQEIPRGRFNRMISDRTARARMGRTLTHELWEAYKEQVVADLLDEALLFAAATAKGVQADSKAVDQQLGDLKRSSPTPELYQETLAIMQTNETELRSEIGRSQVVTQFIDGLISGVTVTEAEAKTYYDANPAEFRDDRVKLSHILIRVAQTDPPARHEEAKKTLMQIRGELEKGADFAALARARSQDPDVQRNGGNLGEVQRGQMVKEFDDAVFAAKKGDLTGPIQTPFGYHLVKIEDFTEGKQRTFDEVKGNLLDRLKQRNQNDAVENVVKALRATAKITYGEGIAAPEKYRSAAAAPAPKPGK